MNDNNENDNNGNDMNDMAKDIEIAKKQILYLKLTSGEEIITMLLYPDLENPTKVNKKFGPSYVLAYPCLISRVPDIENRTMSFVIFPWIEPTFTTTQIFSVNQETIVTICDASENLKESYKEIVLKLMNKKMQVPVKTKPEGEINVSSMAASINGTDNIVQFSSKLTNKDKLH